MCTAAAAAARRREALKPAAAVEQAESGCKSKQLQQAGTRTVCPTSCDTDSQICLVTLHDLQNRRAWQ